MDPFTKGAGVESTLHGSGIRTPVVGSAGAQEELRHVSVNGLINQYVISVPVSLYGHDIRVP